MFEITPLSSLAHWIFGGITVLMFGLGVLFLWMYLNALRVSVTLDSGSLILRAPLYGRSIPLSAIDRSAARIVDLAKEPSLRPRTRTNGIGMPGCAIGWFKLHNKRKALLAVTNRQQLVYLPTTLEYDVLLSLRKPQQFLDRLRMGSSR